MRAVSLIALIILFISCKKEEKCRVTPDVQLPQVTVEIKRAETNLIQAKSGDEVLEFLKQNPDITKGLLASEQYPDLNILAFRLFGLFQDPHIKDTLYNESVEYFEKNEDRINDELRTGFAWMKHYFPEKNVPTIYTMVTGLYNDMYFSDSTIVYGLDYFIGDSATYPPMNIPGYILKRYNYDYLSATLLKFYITDLIATGKENTLLSQMIDYGKVYYLVSMLLPCLEDWKIIGFTPKEMQLVKDNRTAIYATFNQNELWYDISEEAKRKFVGERPNVYEIDEECPGRVGAWLGWEIVQSYVDKTGISMKDLLNETDHHKIFRESGYKAD